MKFRYLLMVAWCAVFSVSYATESESNVPSESDTNQTSSSSIAQQEEPEELAEEVSEDHEQPHRFTANCLITPGKLQVGGPITFSSFGTGIVQSNSSGVLSSTTGTDGQLLIGSSTGAPAWANLMSSDSSVMITNGPNSINLQTTGGGGGISALAGNTGSATGFIVNVEGPANSNITTFGSGDTLTVSVSGTTNDAVQIGNSSGSLSSVAIGATNTVLLGTGGAPTFGQVPNAALVNDSTTLSNGNNITVTGSPVALGGTATINVSGTTNNAVQIGNPSGSLSSVAIGATNTVLLGTGGAPTFGQVPNAALVNDSITLSNGNNITVTGSPVALGGTATINISGTTNDAVQIGNSGGSLTSLAVGTNGQVLLGSTGAAPSFGTLGSSTLTYTPGAGSLSIDITAPVPIAYGGTNTTSFATTDGTVYYTGSQLATTGVGTATQVLTSNGPGIAPSYQPVSSSGAVTSVNAGINISITGTATAPIVNVINSPTFSGSVTVDTGLTVTGGEVINSGQLVLPAGSTSAPSLIFTGSQTNTGLSAPTADTLSFDIKGTEIFNVASAGITIDAFNAAAGLVHNSAAGLLTSSLLKTADLAPAPQLLIPNSNLLTLSANGLVQNSATTATSSNTANTIVLRDGSGNFSAGTITANSFVGPLTGNVTGNLTGNVTGNVTGNLTGNVTGNVSGSASSFTGSLSGDVTGTQSATVVSLVGGQTAAAVAAATVEVDAATSSDVANTLVLRDPSSNFATYQITLDGPITNATQATTKAYVDQAVSLGLTVHTPAVVYASSNFTSCCPPSGPATIDGYMVTTGDRVLLNGQTDQVFNGVWDANTAGTWTYPADFSSGTLIGKAYVLITGGNTFKGSSWVCNTPTSTIGTDSINFVEFALPNNTTGANVGVGTGQVYQTTSGQTLDFRTLLAGSYMTITTGTNEVTIAANGTSSNVANDLVARDGAGNFAAGTITAATGLDVTTGGVTVSAGGATIEGNVLLQSQSALELQDSSASQNFVGIQAPAAVTASYTISMPASAPTAGQVLQATSSPLIMQWATIGGLPATAQTYYVSKTGSDSNNGSFAAPFLTVAHAVSVANGVASPTTPVIIYIGAGSYTENNPSGGIPITSSGINIVGSSMTSTIITPQNPGNDLFGVSTPIVNFYNFTMDTGQSTPTAGNAITYSVAASSEVEAGFHSLAINGFNIGISCNNSGGVITGIICDALQTAGNSTAISVISTNISITVENCIFTGPYTGFTPANTGISITGTATLATLLNNLYRYVVTGITTSGSANARVLGSNFESTTTSIMGSGASFTSIVGCDFINNNTGAVNIGLSGASTDAHIVGCNFQCAPDGGTATGTGVQVITGATVNVSACTIANAVLGLQAGQTGDTSSTSLKATSVILNTCTQDIVQHGSATLQFVGGTFDPITAGKVSVSNPATATFTAFDFANDAALSIGNSADSSQVIYEIYNGEASFPTLNYEPSYFGNKGTLYINSNAGDSVFTGVQSSSNNAYNYVVTGSRTNQAGIDLLSNTGSFGTTTSIRGWSITKLGSTDAPLAFNFFNSDNSGLATIPSYTLMQLDGAASQVSITASVNSTVAALSVTACPTGTGAGASITSNSSAPALLLTGSSTLIAPPLRMVGMPAAASSNFILAIDNSGNVTQTTITDTILGNIIVNGGQAGPLTIGTTNATSLAFETSGNAALSINSNGNVTLTPQSGTALTIASGGASITGATTITGTTNINTSGTAATSIGNSTGNTAVTGNLTITPTGTNQTALTVTGNGTGTAVSVNTSATTGAAALLVGNANSPTLVVAGNGSTTAPALRMTGVPAAASNNFILAIDPSGNVTQTTITDTTLGNIIVNGGQTGPLTIGTTNASVMTFEANNIVGMTVSAGNIGIGSEPTGLAPYTQLVVPGNLPSSAVGSISTNINNPFSLYIQGRYAYVVNSNPSINTLQIFDVSNPSSPALVSTTTTGGLRPLSIYVQGRYAYVAFFGSAIFQVFDVSNPFSPQAVNGTGTATIGTGSYFIYVQGRYAYIAVDGQNKIQIFDISNPSAPVSVSTIATTGSGPNSIYVQGKYAYVTESSSNLLEIFDVSNPTVPISVSTSSTGASSAPVWVYVQGRYAYVINFGTGTTTGLQIFDISNPASPTIVNGTGTGLASTDPSSVYVQGRYAYITVQGNNTIGVYDVSTPTSPQLVGAITTAGLAISPVVQGRYVYVLSQSANSLQIFDLGGAYIQQLEAGGIEVGTLQTRENMTVNNDLAVVGGATFGRGFESNGPSAITVSGSFVASGSVPALILTGNSAAASSTPLRLSGVPTATTSDTVLTLDSSGNVRTTTAALSSLFILNGGQTGPLTIGTTNASVMTFEANNIVGMTVSAGNIGIGSEPTGLAPYTQLVVPGNVPTSAVGSVTTGNAPSSVYVQGRYAYVVNSTSSTLQIIDVSNSSSPVAVNGTPGTATSFTNPFAVYVQGRYAYIVYDTNDHLEVFDVSNPASPVSVGFVATPGAIQGLYVQDRYAYLAQTGSNTLQIVDVSNPAAPVLAGSATAGTSPAEVYVQGKYAYLINNGSGATNGLQIFDVSNPVAPVIVNGTGTATGASPRGIYVQGRYAYITNNAATNSLQIFDVSNPVTPVAVGSFNNAAGFDEVYVQGRYAYVTNRGSNALFVFDVSTPTAPIQIGSVGTGSSPFRLFVQGRYVYLVNSTSTGTTGFQIFDVGGAYIQQLEAGGIEVGTLATRENMTVNNDLCVVGGSTFARGFESTGPSSITASGSYASSSTASGWQPALTVAGQLYVPAMAPPAAVGSVSTGAANYSYIQGRYLYQLNGSGSFQIIDVSNSSTPLVLSTTSLPSSSVGRNIYVQGKYAYITGQVSGFLYIYDVSNPIVPTLANGTGTSTGGVPVGLYVQGRYAYITNNTSNTLQIFDVSSIQDPVLVGSVSTINSATGSLPFAVYVQGIYAYVVCRTTSNQLQIYDVSNPAAPLFKSQVTTGTDAFDVYVQGRYAYVLNTTGSLQIFDVSNPSSIPAAVGSYPLAGTSIVVQGRYAYVASSTVNTIIDVSTPSSPTFVGTFSTTVSGNIRTVVQGRYAYASCNGSLQVFDLGGAYIQQFEAGTIEVGTLATRENMTVNNDLCVVGGSTFGRGFESTGPSAITASGSYASSSTASGWQPALTVAGQLYVPASVPPSAVGSTTTDINSPYSLYVQGRYAYVASFSNSLLLIFDVSNSQVPVLVNTGGTSTGTNPISVYVQGRYAYVGLFGSANFQVFDISDPASPQLISTTPTVGTGSYFVYVQGRYAYIAVDAQNKIQIFDISNPAAPVSVSSTATTTNSPICIYVQGRYAYITENASGRLEIFDVSNPAAPISVNGSTTSTGTNPVWVYVQGRYAYVINFGSGTSNGLQIFDISNPASPVLVSSTPTGTDPSSVYVQGRYAYVTVMGTNTVQIFDVSNPATPVSVGSINTNNGPISPVVQGRYLYLITQAGGSNSFQIFDVGGAYIQQLEAGGIEVGTLATRENMTVNNDLCVVGGATFGRGFESTGTSAITGSSFTASPIPALIITGGSASANSTPLRLINVPTGTTSDSFLTLDGLGNVRQLVTGTLIVNGGQPGALTIGTNNSTTLTLETNSSSGLSIDTSQNVNITNNLLLPNSSSTQGIINFGGNSFISNFGTVNTFVGQAAGNTTLTTADATSNVGIGAFALNILTTGNSNTAVGEDAGDFLTSGSNNTMIGNGAGTSLQTGSNNIYIGSGISGTSGSESNTTRIGGINGATVSGGTAVFVNSSNQLGTSTSSGRYKKDIVDLASVKELIKKLRPISFTYKKIPDEIQYGLLAEDVEKVFPELVIYKDGQPETIRYHLFDAIFIKALQELIAQNEELEKRLSDQQELILLCKQLMHKLLCAQTFTES